jgi:hypothetical protein
MYPHLLKAGLLAVLAGLLIACSGGADKENVVMNPDPAPTTTLTAQNQSVDAGNATTLNWSSVNADQCQASGSWTGPKGTSGSQSTGALNSAQTYTLTCSGSGGSDTATVTVNGTPPPPPPPEPVLTVVLNAADSVVDAGDSTTLTWSSTDASSCQASNGWSGAKAVAGNETLGPLNANTTYTLTCSGAGGNAVAMITVRINGTLSLDWEAPTENVDGSPLTDLSGYKIHYGDSSRNYFGSADVNDANATSFAITLPSGSYYVAMTARDADDNESAYSNEVLKATN